MILATLMVFAVSPVGRAATGSWNVDADGTWSTAGNWASGVIADGATFTGNLTFNLTGDRIVTLDSSRSLGLLNIGDTNTTSAYTLATGTNTLTFDNGAANAQLNQSSTSNGDTITGLLAIGGNGNLTVTNAASVKMLTISAGITSALASGTQTLAFNNANAVTVGGVIGNGASGGTIAVTKTGVGTTTLSGANTYTGSTSISQGTLALSGGNDRLLTTGTVVFNGTTGTLDVGSNSQTLSALSLTQTVTSTSTISGSGGTLTLNGATFQIGGTTASTTQTVTMAGLGTFNYLNASGIFNVGGRSAGTASTGALTLAVTNVITAANVNLAATNVGSAQLEGGFVHLGQTNTINASTIVIGGSAGAGVLDFQAGLTSPTLKIRGTGGTDSDRAAVSVGTNASFIAAPTGKVDLVTGVTGGGSLDAKISTLVVGENTRVSSSAVPLVTGTFTMGNGTLDATSIIVGRNAGTGNNSNAVVGTFNLSGGTVTTPTLTLGVRGAAGTGFVTSNFNLNSGTLTASTIIGSTNTTSVFTWADGTIGNVSGSNQSVSAVGTFTLTNTGNVSGTHTWNVGGANTSTLATTAILSGAGSLTKTGTGTLILQGANTYSGNTTISQGTLKLDTSGTIANSPIINLGTSGSQGTLDITSKSSFSFGTGQTLSGYGTINIGAGKTVTISGNLAPGNSPGILNVTGDTVLTGTTTTTMELAGTGGVAGTDFDKLNVTGALTMGGALSIVSYNGFNIDQAGSYNLIDFTSTTGNFSSVSVAGTFLADTLSNGIWTGTNAGNTFAYQFTTSDGVFVVSAAIPEPSTYATLVGALVLAGATLRRRLLHS